MFIKKLNMTAPDEMEASDKIEVLRGVSAYLLLQVEKLYMHIIRHSAVGHDTVLYRDMAEAVSEIEEMMNLFFPDFLRAGESQHDDDHDTTD
jgi:hypothetical protein